MLSEESKEGASKSYDTMSEQASTLKKGSFVMLQGFPCKIVDITVSKAGKNGYEKVRVTGIDIFTEKKYEDAVPSNQNMSVPIITRKDYEFVSYEADGTVKMLDNTTKALRTDLKVSEDSPDIADEIKMVSDSKKKALVLVFEACGKEMIYGGRILE